MAARKRRIHPEAALDLEQGLLFYLERSPIAAERFLDEVDTALDLIQDGSPERWPLYRLGLRRHVMSSFPYSLIFRATDTEVQIYAIAHAKRRPLYWRKRRF